MTKISKSDFLACVKKSRVIAEDRLNQLLSEADSDDPVELATRMVRDQLLTRWQAKYLMAGRSRLDIGSYRLLERITRDELGDRFLATHKQLERKVDIQVLPADISKDKNRCESFLQTASQTANLDHPNLVHVYDIDQEGGRYFLVTEHVEGITLDSVQRDSMTTLDVGRLVSQSIAGIQFAHENNVTHGNLRPADFLLTDDDSVKIQHLAVASLRSRNIAGEVNDLEAIARIGIQLLSEIPGDNDEDRSRLEHLLQSLATATPASIKQLQKEISDWVGEQDDGFSSAASRGLETGASELAAYDQPIESEQSAFDAEDEDYEDEDYEDEDYEDEEDEYDDDEAFVDERPGFFGRLAQENPIGLIATIIVLAAMLIGGTAWGTYYYVTSAATAKKIAEAKAKSARPSAIEPAERTRNRKPSARPQDRVSKTAGVLTQPSDVDKPNFQDTEAMQRLIDQTIPGDSPQPPVAAQPDAETSSASGAKPPAQTEIPAAVSENPPDAPTARIVTNADAAPAEPMLPSATGNMFRREKKANTDVEKAAPIETKESAAIKLASVPADVDPFTKFPRVTDLPPIEDLTETSLGNLLISNQFLLGAEIFADPAIGKAKMIFEMSRDEQDKQKWIVTVRRREKEKSTAIAYFRKSDSEFLFGWLPEAAKNKYAQYLRNCIIKLKVPAFSQWLTLRKPIELEPIVLTADSPIAIIESEIPHLPRLEEISIEILPVRDIPDVETTLSPAIVEFAQGLPGRILLKESDANAFVWIEVNADLKSKLRIQSSFVLLLANGRRQPIKSLQALDELTVSLKQYEMNAFNDWEIAKNTRAPSGKGEEYDKVRSELEKAANLAKSQTIKAAEYATIVPKLLGRPISIRIYAKLGDHRTELAVMKTTSGD